VILSTKAWRRAAGLPYTSSVSARTRQPNHNQGLFTDHYHGVVLPRWPEWKALVKRVVTGKKSDVKVASFETDTSVVKIYKRRSASADRLIPAALKDLRVWYEEQVAPVRGARTVAAHLERRFSDLINEAYGLIIGELVLLWSTAPPRMPGFQERVPATRLGSTTSRTQVTYPVS
jgi:hypothetical protein